MTVSSPRVIISYSHADQAYLDRLEQHLRPFVREGTIQLWVDRLIKAGDNWREEIEQALNSAQIAILLVSVDFLASDFVAKEELPVLLKAAQERRLVILPVIVNSCLLPYKLSQFQFVNDPNKPLSLMRPEKRDVVWKYVVELVLQALKLNSDLKLPPLRLSGQVWIKRNTLLITLTRRAIIVHWLNIILGTLAFLAVIVAIVIGKIAPDQLEFTNVLGYIAYYTSLGVCCIELYVLAVYRQWLWLVVFPVTEAGVYLFSSFFVVGSWIYVVATIVPLVFIFGWFYISRRTSSIMP